MLQVVFYCSKCVGTYISMRTDNKRKQQKNVSLANLLNFYCINKAHASKEISHVKLVVQSIHISTRTTSIIIFLLISIILLVPNSELFTPVHHLRR